MASKLMGRTPCLLRCGHEAAHVKIKTDKAEGATAWPYVYCPACGHMAHTKSREQAAALARLTRPEKSDESPVGVGIPTPTEQEPENPAPVGVPTPTPTPTPRPPAKKPATALFPMFAGVSHE